MQHLLLIKRKHFFWFAQNSFSDTASLPLPSHPSRISHQSETVSAFCAEMAFGIGRGLTAPLAVLNFILYFIAAALAGSLLNHYFNSGSYLGNGITPTFVLLALIASVVGIASTLAGGHHVALWRTETLAAASATALIAWLLTLLALGVAAKEIHTGGYRAKRLKALEALIIILAFLELLYLLATHAGAVTGEGYANNPAGTRGVKNANYGNPAGTPCGGV